MSLVKGDNMNLFVKLDDLIFVPVMCSKSCTLAISTEIAERTTPDSGIFRQVKPLSIAATLSVDGDVDFDNRVSYVDLIDWMMTLVPIAWSFEAISESGSNVTYQGMAVIANVQATGPVNSPATFSATLEVDGAITRI